MNGVGDYYLLTVRYGNSRHFTVAVNNDDGTPKDMSSETVQMVVYDDSGQLRQPIYQHRPLFFAGTVT